MRFLTLDPWSVQHVLTNPMIYEKPWQIRHNISNVLGNGLLAVEGHIHKCQRRVVASVFSRQYIQGLLPLFFNKGNQLKEKWMGLVCEGAKTYEKHVTVDVYGELKRATLEVVGYAGQMIWHSFWLELIQNSPRLRSQCKSGRAQRTITRAKRPLGPRDFSE